MQHLRQAWAATRSAGSGRFRHVFLPADPDQAYSALVYLGRHTARLVTAAEATPYDHARLHDLVTQEGFSHHPVHGTPPASGFMASYDAPKDSGQAVVHHISSITPEDIATHREAIGEHLHKPSSYQGGWHDTATGDVYLDASRHFHDENDVRKFAVEHQQKAYFNLGDFTERFTHPKLDPLAMKDYDAWHDRYATVGHDAPEGYETFAHRYPATDEQKQFWGERGHHLAAREGKGEHAGTPMGPWRSRAYVEHELARRAGYLD